ncbi:MAG: phage tail protein [Bacteroidales bacterium]|nr:phage tail protein [Bacteroidales bacterium]
MIPILYASSSVTEGPVPTSYGIGALTDCISCECPEERNSIYELSFVYPANGIHADQIQYGSIIKAKPNFTDNPQLFQVTKIGKTMNGQFTVYCQHISYLLSGKVITSGTASSCIAACLLLTGSAGGFTITTDKNVSADFEIKEPSSVRSWFGGKKGSLLDVYGTAEWHYDNFNCELLLHRGQDRGMTIRYGKNLTQLSQEINMDNLCTGIVPFCIDDDGNKTVGTRVATGLVLDFDRDRAIDFSDDVDFESATPIATQLATLTSNYIANNNFTDVFNSITLDFVQLSDLTERVDLCDTVHIYFEALGITASLKCVSVTWDVLNERYTSCTFGDLKSSIADTISTQEKEIADKPSTSAMETAITHATEKISGNLGGYVVFHDADNDGSPDEILIMDTPDITTAVKVWRWNSGGLGYSGNGYAGPFDTLALTSDGKIVADAITTGTLNANLIKAGVISDVAGNSTIDMTNGQATLKNMQAKRRFELIDENGVVRGFFQYLMSTLEPHLAIVDAQSDILAEMWGDTVNGGNIGVNNTSGNRRALFWVNNDDSGDVRLFNENNVRTIWINAHTGQIKAPGTFDKVYDNAIQRPMSSVGDWWTFTTDFAGLLVVGKVVSTGSRTTTIIPIEMLNSTPTRFYLSDESNYLSFDCSVDGDLAKVEIAGKSSSGFIEKVYGMF